MCHCHRRRSGRNSEGDTWRAPKVGRCRMGWGMKGASLLQPTRRSGERCELPQRKTDFGVFWRPQNAPFLYLFDKNMRGTICISVPLLQILGDLSPASPVIYAHVSEFMVLLIICCMSYSERRIVLSHVQYLRSAALRVEKQFLRQPTYHCCTLRVMAHRQIFTLRSTTYSASDNTMTTSETRNSYFTLPIALTVLTNLIAVL